MDWEGGQLTKATVKSTIGGTLRLRSYVPLEGKGLKTVATGTLSDNPLLQPADIKTPLHSNELKELKQPVLRQVYEYEVATRPGQTIKLKTKAQ